MKRLKNFQLIKLRYFPNLVSIRGQNDGGCRSIKLYEKEVTRYESVSLVAGKICVRLVKPGFCLVMMCDSHFSYFPSMVLASKLMLYFIP